VDSIKNSILVREWSRLGVFDVLKGVPYPDEMMTQKELWYMIDLQKNVDNVRLDLINRYDATLYETMVEFLASYGVTTSVEEIKQQLDPYEPIVDYLKVMYNRPRPFQTAGVYGIPLYPRLKTDASDSSYPGGHTLLSLYFRHIYMQSHPDLARPLMRFVLDVAKTREEGGVHHPSDNLFSMRIYKHIKPWMSATHNFYIKGT
jgi:hypothetical protein